MSISTADLQASQRKLAQRTHDATEKAQRKLEKEKVLAARRQARREVLEQEKETRRLEQLRKEEEVRLVYTAHHMCGRICL